MERCLLCLEINNVVESSIQVNSIQWQELEVQNLIEQHLWPIMETIQTSSWLCTICWQELYDFHKFYTRIDEAQKKIDIMKIEPPDIPANKTLSTDLIIEKQQIIIKEHDEDLWADETKFKDPLNLHETLQETTTTKIKSKRKYSSNKFKTSNKDENLQIKQEQGSLESIDEELCNDDSNYEPETKSTKTNTNMSLDNISKLSSKEKDRFIAENFKKITCSLCEIPMENFQELLQHFKETHKQRGYVICCGRKIPKLRLLLEHINYHLDPSYLTCNQCGRVLANRKCLMIHTETHGPQKEKNYYCCDICGLRFSSRFSLEIHGAKHVSDEAKLFPCSICGKNFGNNLVLKSHVRSVHLRPTATCDICGLILSNSTVLNRHKSLKHPVGEIQEYTCSICSKISTNLHAHKTHVKKVHEMGYIHKCTTCDRAFKTPRALMEHVATHTGTDLYSCPWCPKKTKSNASMHAHRKKCHRQEWEEENRKKYGTNLPPNAK